LCCHGVCLQNSGKRRRALPHPKLPVNRRIESGPYLAILPVSVNIFSGSGPDNAMETTDSFSRCDAVMSVSGEQLFQYGVSGETCPPERGGLPCSLPL
jgi:hypothetical protein